jgi:hypothetical protein
VDIQNTVVKEFANDPRVATAVMSQAESAIRLETFWQNVYLRGQMIFDPTGEIARDAYAQPQTGLPFGRSFVIGPDQTVVLALFGYDPDRVINTIYELLAGFELPGDIDGDGDVDLTDLAALLAAYGACEGDPNYSPAADIDDSGCVDLTDLAALLANYGRTRPLLTGHQE